MCGGLALHGKKSCKRAITEYNKRKSSNQQVLDSTALANQCGLIIPMNIHINRNWAIQLSALGEYILSDCLELSGYAARDGFLDNILMKSIDFGVKNDDKLFALGKAIGFYPPNEKVIFGN